MPVQYIPYNQIDKKKWDNCIAAADNALIYARSIYLDTMAGNWDALVLNDYEAVMPLTWRKKYGIHYLYQPYFTSCLGVFGNNINAILLSSFLQSIPAKFRYCDIALNHGNHFSIPAYNLYERSNYVLSLQPGYETLSATFRDNIKRNIRKAEKSGCITISNFPVTAVIEIAKEQARSFAAIPDADYENFGKLYSLLHQQEQAITYGIQAANGQLLAAAVFLFYQRRAYYILVGNHPNGKTLGASHALINAFIKDHAGKTMLLDFEGSDIRNLAFFYSSFGATEEKYAALKFNRLPWPLKWLKK